METIFKVGDTVYCALYGKGKIIKNNDSSNYPLEILFESINDVRLYTKEGKYYFDSNVFLSFSPWAKPDLKRPLDLSIFNETDIFFVEVEGSQEWLIQGNLLNVNSVTKHLYLKDKSLYTTGFLCSKEEITELRLATEEEIKLFREYFPEEVEMSLEEIESKLGVIKGTLKIK